MFLAEIYAFLGSVSFVNGNAVKARGYYEKAIKWNTSNSIVYLNYSIMLLREGDWRGALPLLEKAEARSRNELATKNIMVSKASCFWIGGDIDGAIGEFERVRERYDCLDLNALITLGYMHILKGDYETAEEYTQKALAENPSSGAAWDNLGQIYFRRGETAEAQDAFEKAVLFKPDLPDSLYHLGLIAEQEGDLTAAAQYYRRAYFCDITHFNTVTREQVAAKRAEFEEYEFDGGSGEDDQEED